MISTLTLSEIAAACAGSLHGVDGGAVIEHVRIDSREVRAGDLFVAIRGERFDGHNFVAAALTGGARAVVVSEELDRGAPQIQVYETTVALGRIAATTLASNRDDRGGPDVIALTGSVGKTGTKDLLGQVLAAAAPTVVPVGSNNNETGVPLTILDADPSVKYLVLEMGARHRGNISYLCSIAPPRVGIVLRVGHAHIGEFGSRRAIADTKAELVEALPTAAAGGVAVLNQDDPFVRAMADRTSAAIVSFGLSPDAAVRANTVTFADNGQARFMLEAQGVAQEVRLQAVGAPAVEHALASIAAATAIGLPLDEVVAAAQRAVPRSSRRLKLIEIPRGIRLLDDSYNASPEAMYAALDTLRVTAASGRRIAVLGTMRELGAEHDSLHASVGAHAARVGIDVVIAVGAAAQPIAEAAEAIQPGMTRQVRGPEEAITVIRELLQPGDLVLIKASRAEALDRVVEALVHPEAAQT